ncbi:MAG: hypothetical protein FWE16_05965 [Firmicutes bacterium]|nr:hypothetical protein [Bacillota bacterium]
MKTLFFGLKENLQSVDEMKQLMIPFWEHQPVPLELLRKIHKANENDFSKDILKNIPYTRFNRSFVMGTNLNGFPPAWGVVGMGLDNHDRPLSLFDILVNTDNSAEILMMNIMKEQQGKGYGSEMLSETDKFLFERLFMDGEGHDIGKIVSFANSIAGYKTLSRGGYKTTTGIDDLVLDENNVAITNYDEGVPFSKTREDYQMP